jgi:hypothetical protein
MKFIYTLLLLSIAIVSNAAEVVQLQLPNSNQIIVKLMFKNVFSLFDQKQLP